MENVVTAEPTIDAADIFLSGPPAVPTDEHAIQVIADFCQRADCLFRPGGFTRDEVLQLLSGMEYDVDETALAELVRRRRVPEPHHGLWAPATLYVLFAVCNAQRRWKAGSKLHRLKKSAARLAIEEHGDDQLREDVARYGIGELLTMLTACQDRNVREALLEAALVKLDVLDVHPDA